jgi:hypothetical protein
MRPEADEPRSGRLLHASRSRRPARFAIRRGGTDRPGAAAKGGVAAVRYLLSLRPLGFYERDDIRAHGAGRAGGPHSDRIIWSGRRAVRRNCTASPTQAERRTGFRSDRHFRPQRPRRALGWTFRQPARTCGSLRRSGTLVLPFRRLSQLRVRHRRRRTFVLARSDRSDRSAGRRTRVDLLLDAKDKPGFGSLRRDRASQFLPVVGDVAVDFRFNCQTARGCASAISRRDAPEPCVGWPPPQGKRAQGKPGARRTRGPVCNCYWQKGTRAYRFSGGNPAFPARWATAYSALSRVTGLSCHPHPRKVLLPADLTPASGCQDHTASPSATAALVIRRHRVHRTFATIMSRPSHRVRRF